MVFRAGEADRGKRLDAFLHECLPQFSRSRLQSWIREGKAHIVGAGIDDPALKASHMLRNGEAIEFETGSIPPLKAQAEAIDLTVLYEDASAVAIEKPSGMVVHAGAGVHGGTVVNALLHRFANLSAVGGELRPGIVHRLDRFTSGILLAAKTDAAHRDLAAQFSSRTVEKTYLALVEGTLPATGRSTKPITRDPRNRARMTARLATGRAANTDWKTAEVLPGFTLLEIRIGTGRTHQIRAHMAALRHPVAGDKLYGARPSPWNRYFLHAHRLAFTSPATGARVELVSPLPPDLSRWLEDLRAPQTVE